MKNEILKKVNILYVEDEDEVRSLTTSVLAKFVNIFVEACNGLEGLEKFKEYNCDDSNKEVKFDLVVTDINMPKMDGLKMLEEIHKIDPDIPSIITTAHNDADFLRKAINQRVRGYVNKPLNLHDLIDSIVLAVEPKFLKDELLSANKNLESQVKEKTLELSFIIDSQENMILVLNEDEISNINKTLLEFTQVSSLEEFKERYTCICTLFLEREGYYYTDKKAGWLDNINKLDDIDRVVRMANPNGEERIFQINVKSFFYETKHYVVSFTDITDLKNYTYELQYQATHDNLTKLYNRQKLNDELKSEIKRQQRYGHVFSLIMFDIDNFKSVNDTYGHDVGDMVLKDIAYILTTSVRSTDFPSRWGGEEFMVLLPETPLDATINIAENLRKNIQSHKFNGVPHEITISLGVTTYNKDKDNKESILKNVDVALYQAKHNGKNQTVNI